MVRRAPKFCILNSLVTILILMATHVHAQSVEVNSKVFIVEIADTEEERRKGLMFREALCEECGMLFVFDHPQKYGFWMKNVKIPLDIVYIDKECTSTRQSERKALIPCGQGGDFVYPRV